MFRILQEAPTARIIRLINDPVEYRPGHYLPEYCPIIEGRTPRTVCLAGDLGIDRIMEALAPPRAVPVVVKDYVKSRQHEWAEACSIPSTADRETEARVVARFLELQGEDLAGGLVFREFVEVEPIGLHPRSGMPLTREYRSFWLDGKPLLLAPHWEGIEYEGDGPPLEPFADVAAAVRSRFFTMDLARRRDGGRMIVELGDGQVSGLPAVSDAEEFYEALKDRRTAER